MKLQLVFLASAALAADGIPVHVVRNVALAQRELLATKAAYETAAGKTQAAYTEAQAACAKSTTMFDANTLDCVDGKAFCAAQGSDFKDGKCQPRMALSETKDALKKLEGQSKPTAQSDQTPQ